MVRVFFLFFSLVFLTSSAASSHYSSYYKSSSAEEYYNKIKQNMPQLLTHFVHEFPKGGDIHAHLSGMGYTEKLIDLAIEENLCIKTENYIISKCESSNSIKIKDFVGINDNYSNLIDALSLRNFIPDKRVGNNSGHDHFFITFSRIHGITHLRRGEILADTLSRAIDQNIHYVELMTLPGSSLLKKIIKEWRQLNSSNNLEFEKLFQFVTKEKRAELDKIISKSIDIINSMEKTAATLLKCKNNDLSQCPIKVRYVAQINRVLPLDEIFIHNVFALELIKRESRVLGFDYANTEAHPNSLKNYTKQMEIVNYLADKYNSQKDGDSQHPSYNISLHAGELSVGMVPPEHLRFHIREAIEIGKAKRIGHGITIMHERKPFELLDIMSTNLIPVATNLSSNNHILNVDNNKEHPLPVYLLHQVPVTLSSDDEGINRSNLTNEYIKGIKTYNFTYPQLKMFSRNALEFSFLPGESLWKKGAGRNPESFQVNFKECMDIKSSKCEAAVSTSEKASIQRQLELSLIEFDEKFAD